MTHTERDGGLLARWSDRKARARRGESPSAEPSVEPTGPPVVAEATTRSPLDPASEPAPETSPEPLLTDADMPPLDSLDGHSDYSGFLSPGVSPALRGQALAKLFHSPHLNIGDGLDDFAEDYTRFEPLGDLITADMRHHLERLAKRLLAEGQEAAPSEASPAMAQAQSLEQPEGTADALGPVHANGPETSIPGDEQ